jgi:hypothetical protein
MVSLRPPEVCDKARPLVIHVARNSEPERSSRLGFILSSYKKLLWPKKGKRCAEVERRKKTIKSDAVRASQ